MTDMLSTYRTEFFAYCETHPTNPIAQVWKALEQAHPDLHDRDEFPYGKFLEVARSVEHEMRLDRCRPLGDGTVAHVFSFDETGRCFCGETRATPIRPGA